MRLFVAIRLPEHVVAHVDDALAGARSEHPDLRWVPPERWHLTLAFFGEVAERDVPALREKINRRLVRCASMRLQVAGAGRFDGRVLWVGIAGDVERLTSIATRIAFDPRPYRPHLTVARTRHPIDLRPVVDRVRTYAGPPWHADRIELIESHLGPIPTYTTVDAWTLPGAPGED